MFATLQPQQTFPPLQSSSSLFHYAPARSSPLAPCNVNISSSSSSRRSMSSHSFSPSSSKFGTFPLQFQFSPDQERRNGDQQQQPKSQLQSQQTQHTTATKPSPYAQRYASKISNPLRNISPVSREKRRDIFLNRVKRDREAGKFEARGEQLMMMEYVAEQKQWNEAMRRDADGILRGYNLEEVVEEERELVRQDEADIHALDEYIIPQEEQEMELALVENMERDQSGQQHHNGDAGVVARSPRSDRGSSYGDDDYEDIFMDLADQMDCTEQIQHSQGMDMSSG
ncbi:hypothetical protein VTN00DRAFT_1802 [Thermoascus crustaceus]|uniref:uncharacterized protein n=1 Tax=Thermoascus crustaceus TaxID=5088 RepID=UPI003743365B